MATVISYVNVYGRRGGRGIRPYLLIPKILFVAVFLGGLVTTMVLVLLPPWPTDVAGWMALSALTRGAFLVIIIPSLVGALGMGVLLASMHLRVFLRLRWFQAKLMVMVVCMPTLHVFMWTRSAKLREVLLQSQDVDAAIRIGFQMQVGTIAAIVFAVVVIFLGRMKPRLGQNYARMFS